MRIIILVIVYLGLYIIDYSQFKRSKNKIKSFFVYSLLLSLGFILSVLIAIHKAPPSPAVYIENIIDTFRNGVK